MGSGCYLLPEKLLFLFFFLTTFFVGIIAEVRFRAKTGVRENGESMNKCRG